ncbi:MAG: hypothetical protein EOS23_29945 [Mesorhizobium sp.]|uniref:hypothetical protein n=1 Tax=unclassified Mesorhizobium TaxID=325217 RepID=UPI000FD50B4D|nr:MULTISPECIES: hypothetical protein [unclassified Mesorhizobium]RVC63221.1 hypothetical protein EN779_05555 [Mesorhizobium sp. M4B.F.Ca.ET.088.02.2.1]RVD73438.1 hypothetical protein EN751_04850 [Mesorhizobium sp. M4A.F.Ca.ET.029.04.2.1]MCP9233670.1 hypothetical protein [Mesorhizobium sp. LMG 17147]RWE06783.1 MAG: hypothetical protein EOS23_29945 [Mesorhizobium sp.]RWF30780.1 MAG: hypothetical protein EOS45_13670 [Mesorhizobium sp.]
MTKLEFSTSPTQDQFGGQLLPPRNGGLQKSCQLSGTSRTGRLPSLEKVSWDPVEYDCYGYPKLEGDCKRKADAIDVKLFFFML